MDHCHSYGRDSRCRWLVVPIESDSHSRIGSTVIYCTKFARLATAIAIVGHKLIPATGRWLTGVGLQFAPQLATEIKLYGWRIPTLVNPVVSHQHCGTAVYIG